MQRSSSPLHSRKLVPPADSPNIPTRIAPQPEPINRRVRGEDDQQGNRALIPDTSSGSISSRSASGSSTKESETASSSNSEPAGCQQPDEERVSGIIDYITEHFGVDWPEIVEPYRHVSRQLFDLVRETLIVHHPQAYKRLRCTYDPEKEELTLSMPEPIHDMAALELANLILAKAKEAISLQPTLRGHDLTKLGVGCLEIELRGGRLKIPDYCIWHSDIYYPLLVIEVAHSQKPDELPLNADLYYHGSGRNIRTVLTLDIEYWEPERRDQINDELKKKEEELEQIHKELKRKPGKGMRQKSMHHKKQREKKKLEKKIESMRPRCAYNLYTGIKAQDTRTASSSTMIRPLTPQPQLIRSTSRLEAFSRARSCPPTIQLQASSSPYLMQR